MKYYIIAGEASGDMYGAKLIEAIQQLDAMAVFRFWGGDAMIQASNQHPVRHISDLAIMGFIEVLANLSDVLGNIALCKRDIQQFNPDVLIGIDYPSFNLRIEKWAHKRKIKTIHYISPNLWAWKKNRIRQMRRNIDCLCYILPFEQDFFHRNKMPQAIYVGHPLLDCIKENSNIHKEGEHSKKIIALLPGSRRQEIRNSLPLMAGLAAQHPDYHFVIAGMSLIGADLYNEVVNEADNVEIKFDKTYEILQSAYAAIVCSGTATLETAFFDVPQVVCYRANALSIAIAKAIVSKRIKYISLVNLIADKPVVTELIQEDFCAEKLEKEFLAITNTGDKRNQILSHYANIRQALGSGGSSAIVAQKAVELASLTSHTNK